MALQATSKNAREHERVSGPTIRLQIGGNVYRSVNWSLGGVMITSYQGGLTTGSLLSISELGLGRGVMTQVNVRARVIRADEEACFLALQLLEIDHAAYGILQKLLARKMDVSKHRPKHG